MFLNCHTYYSLHYGTLSVKDLCQLTLNYRASSIAVTDINNTSACLEFIKIAKKHNIKPLVGIDFRNGVKQQYVGIARNNEGFRQLNTHLSYHLHHEEYFFKTAPNLPDCYFIYPFEKVVEDKKTDFRENEFIGISIEDLRKLRFSEYLKFRNKLVFFQTVSFRNKKDHNAHRLLRAIGLNTLLSKLPKEEYAPVLHQMKTPEEIEKAFEDHSFILQNTFRLTESCKMEYSFNNKENNQNLQVFGKSKKEDEKLLRKLCKENFEHFYPNASEEVRQRLQKELNAIIKLGFVSYFLINRDIVQYARKMNFPFIGRGSGANSIVAYIIGITNVDPVELNLFFERFINENRKSPPDFDIDFSWKDRDKVIGYIFEKYSNTALLSTYVTFKYRAMVRELGKVLGLPKENLDKLSAGFFKYTDLDDLEKLVLKYSKLIEGFPNYLSVHAGGIIILDKSVNYFAATFMPPKGFATIQIDMNISEDVGIHKFDILAQRGLPKIADAIEIIKKNQPDASLEDIDNISAFKNDPKINHLLKTGDCMGVFYVESPGMRGLLIKLQTDNYLNLVAASSVIRPGVSQGKMKDEFIKRHRDASKRKEAHPVMYDIMPDTYGIMIYQEDVMKVAHKFAGLSFDDADVLRRGMSGKKFLKEELQKIELKFREKCKDKGYHPQLISEIWQQISSFAGYAFPKGHSASYAVESYQSLYLKCYFPLEYMVAVLNNGGGFYDAETYIQETRRWGGRIHAPCVNKSDHPTVIFGKDIYLGLGYLKDMETKVIQQIIENRQFFGPFQSLDDFLERINISIEQISILIRINAFRFTGSNKYELLWRAHTILGKRAVIGDQQEKLFKIQRKEFRLPEFSYSRLQEIYDQIELLGFTLFSKFELLENEMKPSVKAVELSGKTGKRVEIYGSLITVRKIMTVNDQSMYFATFFDIDGGIFDAVLFPSVARHYENFEKGIYLCRGVVVNEFDYISISIEKIIKQEYKRDRLRAMQPEYLDQFAGF